MRREGSDVDRQLLAELSKEELLDLFFYQVRNLWRVDGLYFLGLEKRHGFAEATAVDAEVWASMGAIEARNIKELLKFDGQGPATLAQALTFTSWALDHKDKRLTVTPDRKTAVMEILNCRTQLTRQKKGLPVFPCKMVREGYLTAFAKEFACKLQVKNCPPDPIDGQVWCRWEFTLA